MARRKLSPDIISTARKLRQTQTEHEALLWTLIKNRQLCGKKFLRQYPITFTFKNKKRFFVADFYCHEAKLIVELDGKAHANRKDHDRERDYVATSLGLSVLRIANDQIESDMDEVIGKIKGYLL